MLHYSEVGAVGKNSLGKRTRAFGGGKKQDFPEILNKIKVWVDLQRSYGNTALKRHLVWQWEKELRSVRAALLEKLRKVSPVVDEAVHRQLKGQIEKADSQLKSLAEKEKARTSRVNFIMKHLKLRNLAPHLLTPLSPLEEEVRSRLGWQAFDSAVHLLSYGTEDELQPYMALTKEAVELKKKTIIVASDQVPVWVKVQTKKELFVEPEYKPKKIEEVRAAIKDKALDTSAAESGILVSRPAIGEMVNSGQKQLRANRNSQDDKIRWTYEARQEVHQYFDPDKVPFGVQGKGAIVLSGVHARLSNIDKRGCLGEG